MQKDKLTFNDLPEVVEELCERIASMETLLAEKLHQQHNEAKKDTHVPMTVDEVCEYLGISKSSFYYKAKHGGIPIIKQGKHLFVYRDELDKWLESGRKGESARTYDGTGSLCISENAGLHLLLQDKEGQHSGNQARKAPLYLS